MIVYGLGVYLIKNNINYTRMKNYEAEDESAVTIKIGYYRMRKIVLTGYYRQWTLLDKDVTVKRNSKSITNQNMRFDRQTLLWEQMILIIIPIFLTFKRPYLKILFYF